MLVQNKVKKSKETNFYDLLNDSLSMDQQLINQGLPIFKMSKLLGQERKELQLTVGGIDSALIGSPVRAESPMIIEDTKKKAKDPGDLMFQTEIDPDVYEDKTKGQKSVTRLLRDYRARIMDD